MMPRLAPSIMNLAMIAAAVAGPLAGRPVIAQPADEADGGGPGGSMVEATAEAGHRARLFVDAPRLEAIREAAADRGSFHQRALAALTARVDKADPRVYDGPPNIGRATLAREAAMAYLITEDRRYAGLAYQALQAILDHPRETGQLDRGDGLSRAAVGMAFALAYDQARAGWTQDQRDAIAAAIRGGLDAWPAYGHANFGGDQVSHWVAVCRSAELLMMLAVVDQETRSDRFDQLKAWLMNHVRSAYGPTGFSQEGIGYVALGGTYLIPAAIALRDAGDDALLRALDAHAFWKLAMYSGSFTERPDGQRRFLQHGVSGSAIGDRGWVSLLIATVPAEHRGHYLWFYDRHMGIESPGEDARRFDPHAAGTTWALLYYPTQASPADPTLRMKPTLADRAYGVYFFRNRWEDGDDVLVSITADQKHHPKAWDQPEAMQIQAIAFGEPFIGGPAKQREGRFFSTLAVDGKTHAGLDAVEANGKTLAWEPARTGGHVVVAGAEQYRQIGVDHVTRQLMVDFEGADRSIMLATVDRIQSTQAHRYAWQANLGDDRSDGNFTVDAGRESDHPAVTVRAESGSYLKAWVITPDDVKVATDDPLSFQAVGTITDIWVVMLLGEGTPPEAKITGRGLDAKLAIGRTTWHYDRTRDRLVRGR